MNVLLEYFTLVNTHISYKLNKRWMLFVDGQNLGNKQFQEINGYNTMGRMFMLGLRLH